MTPVEHWSREMCEGKHRGLKWTIGGLFTTLGLLCTLVLYAAVEAGSASRSANDAAIDAKVQSATAAENRAYVKEDMLELKRWTKNIAEKQDKMNEQIIRLVQVQEKQIKGP